MRILTVLLLALAGSPDPIALLDGDTSPSDVSAIADAVENLGRDTDMAPGWRAYWQALGHWRLAAFAIGSDKDTAKQHLHACIRLMDDALAGGPEAEWNALKSGCHGMMAGTGGMAGMRHGPKSREALDEALLDAPDNARVLLFSGIYDYNTPVMWGGDVERAARNLQKAWDIVIELDEETTAAPSRPTWGSVDIAAWLARTYVRLEEPARAQYVLDTARGRGVWSGWLESIETSLK